MKNHDLENYSKCGLCNEEQNIDRLWLQSDKYVCDWCWESEEK